MSTSASPHCLEIYNDGRVIQGSGGSSALATSPAITRPPVLTTARTPHLNFGPPTVPTICFLKPFRKRSMSRHGVRSPVSSTAARPSRIIVPSGSSVNRKPAVVTCLSELASPSHHSLLPATRRTVPLRRMRWTWRRFGRLGLHLARYLCPKLLTAAGIDSCWMWRRPA